MDDESFSQERPAATQEKLRRRKKTVIRSSAKIDKENRFGEETRTKYSQRSRKLKYKEKRYVQDEEQTCLAPYSWWKAEDRINSSYGQNVQSETKNWFWRLFLADYCVCKGNGTEKDDFINSVQYRHSSQIFDRDGKWDRKLIHANGYSSPNFNHLGDIYPTQNVHTCVSAYCSECQNRKQPHFISVHGR